MFSIFCPKDSLFENVEVYGFGQDLMNIVYGTANERGTAESERLTNDPPDGSSHAKK